MSTLIACEQLYVDLSLAPLAGPAHVQVFVDQEQAAAYSTLSQSSFHLFPGSPSRQLLPGTMLWWDGKPWQTLNLGETAVALLSPEKRVVDLPIEIFEDLLRQNKVTIATPDLSDPKLAEVHDRLLSASPSQLETATYRYKILGRAGPEETIVPARTLQRWRMKFRTAEAIYGHGFVGLIPGHHRQGNHLPRLSPEADQLLEKYITEHYETLKQQSKTAVYLLLEREAKEQGLPVPAPGPFWIASRNGIGRSKRSNGRGRVLPPSTTPGCGNWSKRRQNMEIARGKLCIWTIRNWTSSE